MRPPGRRPAGGGNARTRVDGRRFISSYLLVVLRFLIFFFSGIFRSFVGALQKGSRIASLPLPLCASSSSFCGPGNSGRGWRKSLFFLLCLTCPAYRCILLVSCVNRIGYSTGVCVVRCDIFLERTPLSFGICFKRRCFGNGGRRGLQSS